MAWPVLGSSGVATLITMAPRVYRVSFGYLLAQCNYDVACIRPSLWLVEPERGDCLPCGPGSHGNRYAMAAWLVSFLREYCFCIPGREGGRGLRRSLQLVVARLLLLLLLLLLGGWVQWEHVLH